MWPLVLAAVLTYSAAPALYIQDQLLLLTMLPLPADDDDADADIMHHYPLFPFIFFLHFSLLWPLFALFHHFTLYYKSIK